MAVKPRLVIHGGLGRQEGNYEYRDPHTGETRERSADFHLALGRVLVEAWPVLIARGSREAVLTAVRAMEDDPLFNAGRGSKLQSDGQIRMSAGLMDGGASLFSGAVNAQGVRHPIDLAAALAAEANTVLAGVMATQYARNHGHELRDPFTPERVAEHERRVHGEHGTVGAVALGADGAIVAGTSTGGVGGETPGRVSDTPTVAGTYASGSAGASCTGCGEDITNHAAAARVVVRVEDGASLAQAVSRSIAEANARGWSLGLIALDAQGHVEVGHTDGALVLFAVHDGEEPRTFNGPLET
jgi:L-asparaginase